MTYVDDPTFAMMQKFYVIETFGIWMFYECMERLFPDG